MNAAGFNKVSEMTSLDNSVGTAGLANCIAVVGFNRLSRKMAMAHYDTFNCANLDGSWNRDSLYNFQRWFVDQTHARQFKIGLGLLWHNTSNSKGNMGAGGYPRVDHKRFALINLIKEVFHYEPILAGYSFITRASRSGPGLIVCVGESAMPNGWKDAGTDIPYAKLAG